MGQEGRSRQGDPSDLTDEHWAIVAPLIPPAQHNPRGGLPREVDRRAVLKTICSRHRSGCPWDMLPPDVPPTRTVYASFPQWHADGTWATMVQAWRERTRVAAGREPTPSAACSASPSVKTTEIGDPERGEDGGQNRTGRTRPLWVVARTNAWNGRPRRHRKDDERSVASSTAMIQISHMHLLLHRLAPCRCPVFDSRKKAA